jgi:hypothetical protein
MAATRREVGLVVGDRCTHVVLPTLSGATALCGAGKITQRIAGWFDPDDPLACVNCAEAVADGQAFRGVAPGESSTALPPSSAQS